MKNLVLLSSILSSMVGLVCISCRPVPAGQHAELVFENNSSICIYLADDYLLRGKDPADIASVWGAYPGNDETNTIAPGEKQEHALPQYLSGLPMPYEYILTNRTDTITVFVFPRSYTYDEFMALESRNWNDLKLVSYDLSLEDLVELDFTLSYPPSAAMKNVKMDPEYESFVSPAP